MDHKKRLIVALAMLMIPGLLFGAKYSIDTSHSDVGFKIRHLGISKVRGSFADFKGKIVYDAENVEASSFKGVIAANSINTNNKKRDKHLQSKDFFNVKSYPEITFESNKVYEKDGDLMVDGNLTMHGVTKAVSFPLEISQSKNGKRVVFEGEFDIDRRDFGLTWTKVKAGELVVANTVTIELDISAKR